jgi:signal peptidase II
MEYIVKKNKTLLLLLSVLPMLIIDQFTKYLARLYLTNKSIDLVKNIFSLVLVKNSGAAWGSFSKYTVVLIAVTLILIIALIYLYYKMPDDRHFTPFKLCILFIIGGALGNLVDRIAFRYVTDFLYFNAINFPVFNVADIFVTCSTIILALLIIFYYKDEDFEWLKKNRS